MRKSSKVTRRNWVIGIMAVLLIAILAAGGTYMYSVSGDGDKDSGSGSTAGTGTTEMSTGDGPWADKLVYFTLLTTDKYTGADESATCKVYGEKPSDWGNPRGSFTDSAKYTSYTASSGEVSINQEFPGHYYLVCTVSGSNTEFKEIDIPDGSEASHQGEKLSDYNSQPNADVVHFSAVGSTTDEDFAFTLTLQNDTTEKDTVTLTVGDDTEFRGWKAIIDDTEGFSLDTDGDGTYDEGIKKYEVTICGQTKNVFEPAVGIDEFDSNDEYTMEFDNCMVGDGDDVSIKVEIEADTSNATGANDELWGEGEGVLSYVKIYDNEGNLFSTTDVTA